MSLIDLSWEEGTIGNFAQLSEIKAANRRLIQELSGHGPVMQRITAAGTLRLRDAAAAQSPVDTGTLQSAHRAEVEATGDGYLGTVFIDGTVRNPVNDALPAIYGELWVERFGANWFEYVAEVEGDAILSEMEGQVWELVDSVWL